MVEMRASRREEIPRLKELWRAAFGDPDTYIDYFFDRLYTPERMLLLAEDGVPMTMLALLPMTFSDREGKPARMSYIYALATAPEARLKGYGRQLLNYADYYARRLGADCISTVPAEPSLHRFFGTVGFQECFSTRKVEFLRQRLQKPSEGNSIVPAQAGEYNALRCRLLRGIPHLACADELVEYQKGLSRMEGADIYLLSAAGQEGCAAVEYLNEDTVLVKELIIAPEAMPAAAAQIALRHPAIRYHFRTPAPWVGLPGSYIQPFAMVKWYDDEKRKTWSPDANCYMGLAFD
ncbi:MAG: GNAT family N-acetyltransferase [Pseudoflavonifractor sp.]|nr:GNAT family N-acetyltransferase [Pseudoflavonifractor sp.]MDY3019561.1 GNAT family N-acetyltransferase [Oscillospiraceae bacterium]